MRCVPQNKQYAHCSCLLCFFFPDEYLVWALRTDNPSAACFHGYVWCHAPHAFMLCTCRRRASATRCAQGSCLYRRRGRMATEGSHSAVSEKKEKEIFLSSRQSLTLRRCFVHQRRPPALGGSCTSTAAPCGTAVCTQRTNKVYVKRTSPVFFAGGIFVRVFHECFAFEGWGWVPTRSQVYN